MRILRSILWFVAVGLAAAAPVAGQAVTGAVVEQETGAPVRGAFVVLLDAADRRHAAVLTDTAGRFTIRAPEPGRYRLRAERVGHAGATSPTLELVAEGTLEYRFEVPVQAVVLAGIVVEPERVCRVRPEQGRQTERLWTEARKALDVAAWAQREEVFRYEVVRYLRDLMPGTLQVTREETDERSYLTTKPFAGLRPEALAAGGFVQNTAEGRFYFAPDAQALLSDPFLDTHCFRAVEDAAAPDLVGLGFQPVPGRSVPEVSGALWLERETAALRFLEFRYVNLDPELPTEGVGGRVEFERMPNGAWIERRWRIRMPVVGLRRIRLGARTEFRREQAALREEGGEVLRVFDVDGELVHIATVRPLASQGIRGRITDAETERPVADAGIVLIAEDGTDLFQVTSDAEGRFRLPATRPGTYTLRVERLGYATFVSEEVRLRPREQIDVRIRLGVAAVPLAPLTVVGRGTEVRVVSEFDRRLERGRRLGFGHFITRGELERSGAVNLGSVLARVPRVPIAYGRDGKARLGTPFRSSTCTSHLYLNGIEIQLQATLFSLDELVSPHELEGIEVYRSMAEIPIEYARPNACVVVALWTQSGGERGRGGWLRNLIGGGLAAVLLYLMLSN